MAGDRVASPDERVRDGADLPQPRGAEGARARGRSDLARIARRLAEVARDLERLAQRDEEREPAPEIVSVTPFDRAAAIKLARELGLDVKRGAR
jgi:hypothetical protein